MCSKLRCNLEQKADHSRELTNFSTSHVMEKIIPGQTETRGYTHLVLYVDTRAYPTTSVYLLRCTI